MWVNQSVTYVCELYQLHPSPFSAFSASSVVKIAFTQQGLNFKQIELSKGIVCLPEKTHRNLRTVQAIQRLIPQVVGLAHKKANQINLEIEITLNQYKQLKA